LLSWHGYKVIFDPEGNWKIYKSDGHGFLMSQDEIKELSEDEFLEMLGIPLRKHVADMYKKAVQMLTMKDSIPEWESSFEPKNVLEEEIIEMFRIMILIGNIERGLTKNLIYSHLPERKHRRISAYLKNLSNDLEEEYVFMSAPMIATKFIIELDQARFHLAKWLWGNHANR
jgi:hypothetical protein